MSPPITRPQAQTKKRVTRTRRRHRRIMTTATVVLAAALVALLTQGSVQASTWDEIVALDTAKAQARGVQPVAQSIPTPSPMRPFVLSDGRLVQPEDWKLVLFLQSTCCHCKAFDPELKAISKLTGFEVFPYSLDNQGDESFPAALPASPEVILEFFSNGLPIATPTTYLVNAHTLTAYSLQQGTTDANAFMMRLDEVLRAALDEERPFVKEVPHAS